MASLLPGCAVSFVGGMSAAGVGIGGGSLYLPVFIMQVGNEAAVPLAKFNSAAVSAAALCINIQRRHEIADRPLTNYDLVLLIEPLTLLGTICGVVLNVLLLSSQIRAFIVLVLVILTLMTVWNGYRQFVDESAVIKDVGEAMTSAGAATKAAVRRSSQVGNKGFSRQVSSESEAGNKEPLLREPALPPNAVRESKESGGRRTSASPSKVDWNRKTLEERRYSLFAANNKVLEAERGIPWMNIGAIVLVALVCFGLEFFSGGGLALFCGSSSQQLALAAAALGVLAWTSGFVWYLVKQSSHWISLGISEHQAYGEKLSWTARRIAAWLMLAFLAGLGAGCSGISGGIVKAPAMVAMGISPSVVAATSNFMVLFTSSSTTFQYWLLGRVQVCDAAIYGAAAFAGALLGQVVFVRLQEWSKRQSFVTVWLAVEIGLSVVCTVVSWYLTVQSGVSNDANLEDVCGEYGKYVEFSD